MLIIDVNRFGRKKGIGLEKMKLGGVGDDGLEHT
jgi:hypothetical protein